MDIFISCVVLSIEMSRKFIVLCSVSAVKCKFRWVVLKSVRMYCVSG
jgi:hypothetical protein